MLFGLGQQIYCLNSSKKETKKNDLIAESTIYEPSYQQYPSPVEHSSAYKNYNDGHDSYGKYNKAYGDHGYNHYGKFE